MVSLIVQDFPECFITFLFIAFGDLILHRQTGILATQPRELAGLHLQLMYTG